MLMHTFAVRRNAIKSSNSHSHCGDKCAEYHQEHRELDFVGRRHAALEGSIRRSHVNMIFWIISKHSQNHGKSIVKEAQKTQLRHHGTTYV